MKKFTLTKISEGIYQIYFGDSVYMKALVGYVLNFTNKCRLKVIYNCSLFVEKEFKTIENLEKYLQEYGDSIIKTARDIFSEVLQYEQNICNNTYTHNIGKKKISMFKETK